VTATRRALAIQTPLPAVTLPTISSSRRRSWSRNVLRDLDAEPVLEFEEQFEQQERVDLEFLERASGVTRAGSMFSRLRRNSLRTAR